MSLVTLAPDTEEHIVRPFHLILSGASVPEPRRVDFVAESPDHASQVARNEEEGIHVELWEGATLLARMTKGEADVWQLLPVRPGNVVTMAAGDSSMSI
ncbi:hypothetical protein [Sphingopyxis macrogoltabida]|uniref:hypothetical protein n=1 Tax=Sphingopyxis macrogoltabida TaxID=33050 RepID=UPI0011AB4CC7|nr:hypothetical protein [Sphingopyxis macrogoltabida]